jgi:hypothetical protein
MIDILLLSQQMLSQSHEKLSAGTEPRHLPELRAVLNDK